MAKTKPAPAPAQPAAANKPTPYPREWGSMSLDARKDWLKKNRPNRKQTTNVKPTTAPAPAPAPAPVAAAAPSAPEMPGSKPLVQIDVVRYSVRVGTREPVETTNEELLQVVDDELDAWEEQCQGEQTDEETGEEEES